ncbi:hypothetical protein GGF44_002211, partial [Coemansia sp. RSA 1694]
QESQAAQPQHVGRRHAVRQCLRVYQLCQQGPDLRPGSGTAHGRHGHYGLRRDLSRHPLDTGAQALAAARAPDRNGAGHPGKPQHRAEHRRV